jgi:predicted dehydrogenase
MWEIGIIGTGYISETHLKAWAQHPNAAVTAMCDLNEQKLHERARNFGIPQNKLFTDIDQMLESEDIDIVDIITGPESHLGLVRKAAGAGKQILCQKPFAPSLDEAQAAVQAAKDAGVRLMVTENWRWQSQMQNVKKILDSGILGTIFYAKYVNLNYFTPRLTPEKEMRQPYFRDMPRLLMYEMGTHWFDVWRFLFGEPKRLYTELRRVSPYIKGDDVGTVFLGHDGFHGIMEMSWASRRVFSQAKQEQFLIETDRNSLIVYGDGTAKLLEDNKETLLNGPLEHDYIGSFHNLQSHFLHCLETGEPFQTSGEDNIKTLRLVFAAYESSRSHEVIKLS